MNGFDQAANAHGNRRITTEKLRQVGGHQASHNEGSDLTSLTFGDRAICSACVDVIAPEQ
jgi:hypothetical protein